MDIRKVLKPDKFNLDTEWEDQPLLIYDYGMELRDTRERAEALKRKAARLKAKIFMEMKEDPERFDLPKATDACVTAAVEWDSRYLAAQKEADEANSEYEEKKLIMEALRARRSSLEFLTQLFLAQYFARKPKIKTGAGESEADHTINAICNITKKKKRIRARKA